MGGGDGPACDGTGWVGFAPGRENTLRSSESPRRPARRLFAFISIEISALTCYSTILSALRPDGFLSELSVSHGLGAELVADGWRLWHMGSGWDDQLRDNLSRVCRQLGKCNRSHTARIHSPVRNAWSVFE
jgi:hypothetical protein